MYDRISNLSGLISARALQNFTFVAAFLAVWFIFNVSGVYAANYLVNSATDANDIMPGNGICEIAPGTGICTLRAAITEANAVAGNDIITLPPGTYTNTLVGAEDANASGDLDIRSNITINGSGSGSTFIEAATIAGTAVERVFDLPVTATNITAVFNNLTVRNGRIIGSDGGGIFVHANGDKVTFNNCIISNNFSDNAGGGIASMFAVSITLNNTTVTANTVRSPTDGVAGGGIYLDGGTLIVSDSTIINNTTSSGASPITYEAQGGGIAYFSGTATITNSTVSNNFATTTGAGRSFGGGIATRFGNTLNITNSIISNNTANSTGGGNGVGGGINNEDSTLNLIGSTLSGNTADSNAGIRIAIFSRTLVTATISRSAIINNFALTGDGGGVVNYSAGTAATNINNSTIGGNRAIGNAGGILNITDSGVGGTATLNLNFSTVANNGADLSGGVANISNGIGTSTVNLKNSIVADNTVGTGGTAPDLAGAFISGGYNHIENASGSTIFNIMASDISGSDPQLTPLAFNGGITLNYKPAATSPVLDTIPNGTNGCGTAPFNVDQRNMPRPTDSDNNGVAACEKGSVEVLAPTAAAVSIGGRVSTANGRGIRNARLTLTDSSGAVRTVLSSAFGNYRFTDVAAGETYILSISSKRFVFDNPTQVVNVAEDLDDLNFTAVNKFQKLFGSDFIAPK